MAAWESLTDHFVHNAPPSAYYIPNIITAEEEEHLLQRIYEAPKPKWTHLANRRLQDYGGIANQKGLIPDSIPEWLQIYMDRVSDMGIFGTQQRANHCLVNEYTAGQGIMPHLDGPIFTPVISTITCGSHGMLEFADNDSTREIKCKLLLERRSLVIMKDDLYTRYLHSIRECTRDAIDDTIANRRQTNAREGEVLERGTRVSLTIRNVPKVYKLNIFNLHKK